MMIEKKPKLGRLGRMNLKKLISKHPRRSDLNTTKSLSHWKTSELIEFCELNSIDYSRFISQRQKVESKDQENHNPQTNIDKKSEDKNEELNFRFLTEQVDIFTSLSLTICVMIEIEEVNFELLLDDQNSILEVKKQISANFQLPVSSIQLLHNNRIVKDEVKILTLASDLFLQLKLLTTVKVVYYGMNGVLNTLKCYHTIPVHQLKEKIEDIEKISNCKLFVNDIDITNSMGSIMKCYAKFQNSIYLRVQYNSEPIHNYDHHHIHIENQLGDVSS